MDSTSKSKLTMIKGLIRLIRPQNCLAAAGFVFLGAFLNGIYPNMQLVVASIAVTTILAGCNIYNDGIDIEIDRINKPSRPLPSGLVSKQTAFYTAYSLIALGVFASLFLSFACTLFALICSGLGLSYSLRFKNTVLTGNVIVAFLSASILMYGGYLAKNPLQLLIVSIAIFLFMLAREIIKLIDDYEGDKAKQVKTLATVYGRDLSLRVSILLFALHLVVSFIPYWTLSLSQWYLVIAIGIIHIQLIAICILLWRSLTSKTIKIALWVTKGDFYLWCFALLAGKLL
jgi:geranylgeranylglycerol-phosphate geranylgeranyltransferase